MLPLNIGVSIILPAFNAEKTIGKNLKKIIAETKNFNSEIIVVDDNSTDNTSKVVEKFKKIKLIKLKSNKGAGNARNVGAKFSKYKNLCFIDSDILIGKNSIYNLLKRLFKDKKTGSVAATQDTYNLNKNSWSSDFVCLKSCYGTDDFKYEIEFSSICSEFCAISKNLFNRIGKWKTLPGAGGEEFDMGYKIRKLNKVNIKLKSATYSGFWCDLLTRSKRIIARTVKYIPVLFKKKSFDTVGSFATIGQASSAFLSLLIILSLFSYLFLSYNFYLKSFTITNNDIILSTLSLFVVQIIIEYKFIIYALKKKGLGMLVFSIIGMQVINISLIIGAFVFLLKSILPKSKNY